MDVEIYSPPPPRPSPPQKPPRKFRSTVIMSAIFLGSFVVCLAVLSRHELAQMVSQHVIAAKQPDNTRASPLASSAQAGPPGPRPLPPPREVDKVPPPAVQATPPSVFQ
jgi:hypothetical protein